MISGTGWKKGAGERVRALVSKHGAGTGKCGQGRNVWKSLP